MKLIGYYNERGYRIESDNPEDATIYQAGNHALESTQDATGTKFQLPLKVIKKFCIQTGKEIAKEKNAKFIGVEYEETEFFLCAY